MAKSLFLKHFSRLDRYGVGKYFGPTKIALFGWGHLD